MGLLGALLIVLAPVLVSGQSLSDVAQKERERRQKLKVSGASAQVITEEALKTNKGSLANDPGAAQPSPPPTTEPGAASSAVRAASPTPRPPAAAGPTVVSEQEWRGRAAETRRRIAERQRRYDYVSSLRSGPGESFLDETGKRVVASPENLAQAFAAAQLQLDAARKDMEDLQEAARRANVPPGVLR